MAAGLLLPSGLCDAPTQKPGALSLTEEVSRAVSVLHQVICYAKCSSVYRLLLLRGAVLHVIPDNKRAGILRSKCFVFVRGGC